MPDVIEQTRNGSTITTKWWSNYLTPQTMVWILAGFISIVLFWKDSKDNWAKTETKADESEVVSLREELKDLKAQVNNQYSTQRSMNDKTNAAIENVADLMHEQIGYENAINDKQKNKSQ